VEDQKLVLRYPKSGKEEEIVFILQKVAHRLKEYILEKGLAQEDRIFRIAYAAARVVVQKAGKPVGADLSPHDLRGGTSRIRCRRWSPGQRETSSPKMKLHLHWSNEGQLSSRLCSRAYKVHARAREGRLRPLDDGAGHHQGQSRREGQAVWDPPTRFRRPELRLRPIRCHEGVGEHMRRESRNRAALHAPTRIEQDPEHSRPRWLPPNFPGRMALPDRHRGPRKGSARTDGSITTGTAPRLVARAETYRGLAGSNRLHPGKREAPHAAARTRGRSPRGSPRIQAHPSPGGALY
jgi:hypothetical protein